MKRGKLKQLQQKYTDLCNETGLTKDYNRMKITNNKLNKEEQYAINKYISSDFYPINEKLRNKEELSKEEMALVLNLDNALDKLPRYKGIVTRSLELDESQLKEFLKKHSKNNIVPYEAYTSTTIGEKI